MPGMCTDDLSWRKLGVPRTVTTCTESVHVGHGGQGCVQRGAHATGPWGLHVRELVLSACLMTFLRSLACLISSLRGSCVPLIPAPVLDAACMLGAAKEGHFRKKGIWLRIARGDAGDVSITCQHICVGGSI